MSASLSPWSEVLAAALIGTARAGTPAEPLLEAAAAHALRRRAGVTLIEPAESPVPAPVDQVPAVGPAAAARAGDLLAFDDAARMTGPLRDLPSRLELLAEWLAAAAAAGRRLPGQLVPALLDAGRRHRGLRRYVGPVGGARVGWLAAQRPDWAYATSTVVPSVPSDVEAEQQAWQLGPITRRKAYLEALRRREPAAARAELEAVWDTETPEDRAELLSTLAVGLSIEDDPLLERALDDRRAQVRAAALELLGELPDSWYGRRMVRRALECVDLSGTRRIAIVPPSACDRSMRRDGINPRPPGGTGERAWWLEEILARTPLDTWPPPAEFLARRVSDGWAATLRRGLARAAAAQRDGAWAAALVDSLTAEVAARGHPDDRLLLEALYDALPPDELAVRATAALRRGLARATAIGVEHVLELCPKPWPPAVVDAVFAALDDPSHGLTGWRVAGLCQLAALRLPADAAPRAAELAERVRAARPGDPGVAVLERFAEALRFRYDMLEELT